MATHSSVLAWRIPGTGQPGGLPSMGLHATALLDEPARPGVLRGSQAPRRAVCGTRGSLRTSTSAGDLRELPREPLRGEGCCGVGGVMQETWVQFLDWKDPLEEGMATHFSILAWRIPWTEEPGGLQSMGLQRFRQRLTLSLYFHPLAGE